MLNQTLTQRTGMAIPDHLTDSTLAAKAANSHAASGPRRVAEALLTIPAEHRVAASLDANRMSNMVPGERYSDSIESAVRAIKREMSS